MKKFEGFDYEKAKEKWFEKGEQLTVDEINGLFGKIEVLGERIWAIKEIANE